MMNKKSAILIGWMASLVLLTLACNSLGLGSSDERATATPKSWPYSTFIPPRASTQVSLGQELVIESYHSSTVQLDNIQVWVNGQLLTTEDSTAAGKTNTFPNDLATVRLITEDGEVTAGNVTPAAGPVYNKTVLIVWTGHVPGAYELSMSATDTAKRTGNTITQRIEVK
jgi:hypothetical protein